MFSCITKTYLYTFDPLKPHFYIVKLGFTGVYIIFLISAQNINCGYSLEPPRRGGSNEYPQSMFWAEIWKISDFFIWKFHFLVAKFSIYLNRRVFVMTHHKPSDKTIEYNDFSYSKEKNILFRCKPSTNKSVFFFVFFFFFYPDSWKAKSTDESLKDNSRSPAFS